MDGSDAMGGGDAVGTADLYKLCGGSVVCV